MSPRVKRIWLYLKNLNHYEEAKFPNFCFLQNQEKITNTFENIYRILIGDDDWIKDWENWSVRGLHFSFYCCYWTASVQKETAHSREMFEEQSKTVVKVRLKDIIFLLKSATYWGLFFYSYLLCWKLQKVSRTSINYFVDTYWKHLLWEIS